jgi:hypothetical protein
MNKTKIALGIGILLAVLAVFTASASATNVMYFDPDHSRGAPGETVYVELRLNSTEGVTCVETDIYFDPSVLNITNVTPGAFPNQLCWCNHGNFVSMGGVAPDWCDLPSGDYLFVNLTFEANNTGTSTLTHDRNHLWDGYFEEIFDVMMWPSGTFNCSCPTPETFTKSLAEGWNLISLPLTNDTDMTVANIINKSLEGKYDALYKYNASTHSFVPLSSTDTMENGVGYFIYMTTGDTWTYTGSAYTSMNVNLQSGLNMIGWLNCLKPISDGLSSIAGKYRYVSLWNTTSQSYKTYNPAAPDGFNDFADIERGTGYFISMKEDSTLGFTQTYLSLTLLILTTDCTNFAVCSFFLSVLICVILWLAKHVLFLLLFISPVLSFSFPFLAPPFGYIAENDESNAH